MGNREDLARLLVAIAAGDHSLDHGSTPSDLARWTTGRGGVGSEAAKLEQQTILDLLEQAMA